MLDFRRANTDGECAEGAVGGRVAVAAHYYLSGLGVPLLGPYDVYDALERAEPVVQRHAELLAVPAKGVQLLLRDRIGDGQRQVPRRGIVVRGRDGEVGAAHSSARHAQAVERLRGSDLVHEVQVDVQDRRLSGLLVDDVAVPDLLEHSPWRHLGSAPQVT